MQTTTRTSLVDVTPEQYVAAHAVVASAWDTSGGSLDSAFRQVEATCGRIQGQSLTYFWRFPHAS